MDSSEEIPMTIIEGELPESYDLIIDDQFYQWAGLFIGVADILTLAGRAGGACSVEYLPHEGEPELLEPGTGYLTMDLSATAAVLKTHPQAG